jgi:hypothetical protein
MRIRRRTFATPLVVTVAACGGSPKQAPENPPRPRVVTEWTVYQAEGTCFAVDAEACPVPSDDKTKFTCQSTSQPYECPEGLTLDRPIVVVRVDPSSCEMKQEMPDCPEGASCNPPPPMPLACPTE